MLKNGTVEQPKPYCSPMRRVRRQIRLSLTGIQWLHRASRRSVREAEVGRRGSRVYRGDEAYDIIPGSLRGGGVAVSLIGLDKRGRGGSTTFNVPDKNLAPYEVDNWIIKAL